MKYLSLLLVIASVAAGAMEPGSQYKAQAEAGDPRAQYYLADTYVSFGDFPQAEYWAQKAADKGDGDALALLAQLKIRNPQQADYIQAKALAEKSVKTGSRPVRQTIRTPSPCYSMPPRIRKAIQPSTPRCCWGLSTPAAFIPRKMT